MEILWSAVGICVIVCFLFYLLAQHWQQALRKQSWTIRRLADRVQSLEDLADPQFRRRIGESAPMPLKQVFTFSFRLSDRFWRDKLQIRDEDWEFIRRFGSFVGSVKLERWRSHTVATITEVLPASSSARWQARSLDFYPDPAKNDDAITLWELRLAPTNELAPRPPSLELILRRNAVELRGHLASSVAGASGNGHPDPSSEDEVVFIRVPLDHALLAEFRCHDPAGTTGNGNSEPETTAIPVDGNSWQTFYSRADQDLGIEWQLRLRDLTKKAESERSRILESAKTPPDGTR
jgi:hypothetical protein